jgi:hypothetical protein
VSYFAGDEWFKAGLSLSAILAEWPTATGDGDMRDKLMKHQWELGSVLHGVRYDVWGPQHLAMLP